MDIGIAGLYLLVTAAAIAVGVSVSETSKHLAQICKEIELLAVAAREAKKSREEQWKVLDKLLVTTQELSRMKAELGRERELMQQRLNIAQSQAAGRDFRSA